MKNNYRNEEIDLLELAMFLLRKWLLLILALLLGSGIGLAVHQLTVKPSYEANTEIYITNSNTLVSFQDIQLSAELTADYQEILLSRQVLKNVIADQQLNLDYATLRNMISIKNPSDSHCLKIFVTAETPEKAVRIANSIVFYGIDQIYRIVGRDEPATIDRAEVDAVKEVTPSLKKYCLIGAGIAEILVVGILVIRFLLDSTLKSEEDVEKYLQLPVLVAVPKNSSYTTQSKKKQGTKKEKRHFHESKNN